MLCDNFLQGKSADDVLKGVSGEGQLVLAMMSSFTKCGGAHDIFGILISPDKVSDCM